VNQVIAVLYQPGAYGSFVSWLIERTNEIRQRHEPAIMDDPLLPDGSSHAYASFCKIKDDDDFISGLNEARWDITPWHTKIYAGWPVARHKHITPAFMRIQEWMTTFDRMVYVSCDRDDDHYLRYLRNETTMDRDRWYGMLGITSDDQLTDALLEDLTQQPLLMHDPRMVHIRMQDLLSMDKDRLLGMVLDRMGWPICDMELAADALVRMRLAQQPQRLRLQRAKDGDASSPAMRAVRDAYQQRKGN
jgi:hypothetical protein